jgi:gamma-butyrobetaine dioxygenase
MTCLQSVECQPGGAALAVHWRDGRSLRFHAIWLRDNSPDPSTRSVENGQRLITLQAIPADTRILAAEVAGSLLRVHFGPEDKWIDYPASWLRAHGYDRPPRHDVGWLADSLELWDRGSGLADARGEFSAVKASSEALAAWLTAVERYGFATLCGGPRESGALLDVVKLFGFVRETNYGRWFEVRSEAHPANLAYTGLGLQPHSDNPYRDPVPTLQILFCLEDAAEGGDSLVVDGFAAAKRLQAEDPGAFDLLARYCARFAYRGRGDVALSARRPILELTPDGELIAVRFNNRSMAALTDVPFEVMADYYRAYRRLGEIIEDPAMAVTFKLAPGACFIVDNTRVLHGRTGFSGGGSRWLQGCYADKDGLASTLSLLRSSKRARVA